MHAVALLALLLGGAVDKRLDVYWIDVEGGAATLVVTPAGESVLIDTGNPGGRDPGRIHKVATESAGLTRIDHVVITHLHGDHFGGLAELAELMPVGTVWENGVDSAPERERNDKLVPAYQAAKVEKRVVIQPGKTLPLAQAKGAARLTFTFLGTRQAFAARKGRPNKLCASARPKNPDTSDNANSAVMLIELGPFRFFDGGDLTWNVEEKLVCPVDRVGPVDVFQVNHHGLDSSNNPVLVHTLAPAVAVFNNGPRKGCMPEAFATVKASPGLQAIYQVHKNLVSAESNTADEQIANGKATEQCAGNYVKMSVDPRGTQYTMLVPATSHEKSYRTRRR